MPVRIQSLCRMQKVLRLPASSSRFHGTIATSQFSGTKGVFSKYVRQKGRFYSSSLGQAKYDQKNTVEKEEATSPAAKSKQPPRLGSTPFDLLAHEYVMDGGLPRSRDDKLRQDGSIQLWGSWGVPIRWRYMTSPNEQPHAPFPNFWLRDNCRCAKCVNQDTMQRAFDTFSIPQDIIPREVVTEKAGLRVTWANDGHVSLYPWEWLFKHRLGEDPKQKQKEINQVEPQVTYWGSEIKINPPSVHYDEVMADDKGVGLWTSKIRKFGFCFVDGCPVSPEKTQQLLERISFVRLTHYGGFYDFTSDLTMKDTAYTSLALQAHTDTTYFTDPAGLQMFHLLSHTDGGGGASLLVDGFHAAAILAAEDIEAYNNLCHILIPSHASGNEGITIVPSQSFPVLNVRPGLEQHKPSIPGGPEKMKQIRWNNDDRGTITIHPNAHADPRYDAMKWYQAARKWNEILKRESMEYWEQLKPGRPLIFDNWRVLHGRSAFDGKRRICGGYINHDDFISRWRNTNFTRKEALAQIL